MNKNNEYRSCMVSTLNNSTIFPIKQQTVIMKRLRELGIVENLSQKTLLEIIREDNENYETVINEIENYEFEKPYTYHFLYSVKDVSKISKIKDDENFNTKFNTTSRFDSINTNIYLPKYHDDTGNVLIKFTLVLSGDDHSLIRIPVLCDFIPIGEEILLKLCFDMIPNKYQTERFHVTLPLKVEEWLYDYLQIELFNFNSFQAVENLLQYKLNNPALIENITENSEYSNDLFQGKVKLRANTKEELPLVAQLKEIINKFDSQHDKNLMNLFFLKLKETSDFYQRGLKWHFNDNGKKESLIADFKKNYMGSGKVMVHVHSNNLPKERIDYVIKDLAKYRDLSKLKDESETK